MKLVDHLQLPTLDASIFLIVGNDARKAVADGFPMSGVIASDLRQCKHLLKHLEDSMISIAL